MSGHVGSAGDVIRLDRSDVRVMLWHLCLYGLAAILQDAGVSDVRLSWDAGMQPKAQLRASATPLEMADVVLAHARARNGPDSWIHQDVALEGKPRGLMSPRITPLVSPPGLRADVQRRRHEVLQELTLRRAWLDLALLAALGEPAYWSQRQGVVQQDDGASRLEMQPRNQGSEFVGSRLRKLTVAVSARTPDEVLSGLSGHSVHDEAGQDKVDSRTATGLANPGPTDNAVAWCALWGISQLPISARVHGAAATSGHLGRGRTEWFYLPYWTDPLYPARVRTLLASSPLGDAASVGLPRGWSRPDVEVSAAQEWLKARRVRGVLRFPVQRFGSDSAPERRAMMAEIIRLDQAGSSSAALPTVGEAV